MANAQTRAEELVTSCSHTRPDGTKGTHIISGYEKLYVGENIAMGQTSASQVTNDWINSEGHYATMTNEKYTKIGVGCVECNGVYYWVQLFSN